MHCQKEKNNINNWDLYSWTGSGIERKKVSSECSLSLIRFHLSVTRAIIKSFFTPSKRKRGTESKRVKENKIAEIPWLENLMPSKHLKVWHWNVIIENEDTSWDPFHFPCVSFIVIFLCFFSVPLGFCSGKKILRLEFSSEAKHNK